jgi:glycosyltransferase involved in cell wall biosynthesis
MKTCVIVPAYEAERTLAAVLEDLARELRPVLACAPIVVDDGSTDATADVAREAGAIVLQHGINRGKGAALVSGLEEAARLGCDAAISVDADGQHPAASAVEVLRASNDPRALVLGVRDLDAAGAPGANKYGNGVSNYWLSFFAGRTLRDTQCGLRRYPVNETLALGVRARGYAFEAEVILRACAAHLPIVERPIAVIYPPENERRTHFRRVMDPTRIVLTVVRTVIATRVSRPLP